jgi:outer membrane protein, heavy metal efflux system
MRPLFQMAIVVLSFCTSVAHSQSELSHYLQIGAENNPGLKAQFTAYYAALEKIPQVGALPDPSLSFGYFISPIETRVGPQIAKVGINQMLPWFGTLNAREDVAMEMAKAKFESFEEAKSMLFFDIKSTYYDIYFVQKAIDITHENLQILSTLQELSIIKIETGKASVVDELRVEMEINELVNKLAYLEDTKVAMEVKFRQLLNSSEDLQIAVPNSLEEESLTMTKEELLDSISVQNHLLKQLDHKILSWQNQEVAAQKMGMPQLSVGFDYSIIGKSDNPNLGSENGRDAVLFPKIGISIPLYRKKYTSLVKESALNLEATQWEKEEKENQLTSLFEFGYKDYLDATRRIELFETQSLLAEKSLNILITSYSTDGDNFEEVIRIERKVLQYALEGDKARADKSAAIAFISFLMGN